MTRLSHLTLRNFLIAAHDVLATACALFIAFYLRFEGGPGFYDRVPLLLQILPYFLLFSVVVCYFSNLTTTKWRFISLPDALNILRVATVLTLALLVMGLYSCRAQRSRRLLFRQGHDCPVLVSRGVFPECVTLRVSVFPLYTGAPSRQD